MQKLPLVPSLPHYTFNTVLGDTAYNFEIRWNGRDAAWYMSVFEQDETPIFVNAKIVLGANIGRKANHPLVLTGVFLAIDTEKTGIDATLDDLGSRIQVRYYTDFDILAGIVSTSAV